MKIDKTCLRSQETDKATMDVEAQEDGVLGKIIVSLLHSFDAEMTPDESRPFRSLTAPKMSKWVERSRY
jgi:hypothetical protein